MQVASRKENQQLAVPAVAAVAAVFVIFGDLNFIFDTRSLYLFKDKVLRVLLQLKSSNSEHRNSRYDLDTRDYYMFKTGTRIWLEHGPTLSELFGPPRIRI